MKLNSIFAELILKESQINLLQFVANAVKKLLDLWLVPTAELKFSVGREHLARSFTQAQQDFDHIGVQFYLIHLATDRV
jgi:hypothetical protein